MCLTKYTDALELKMSKNDVEERKKIIEILESEHRKFVSLSKPKLVINFQKFQIKKISTIY